MEEDLKKIIACVENDLLDMNLEQIKDPDIRKDPSNCKKSQIPKKFAQKLNR